MVSSSRQLLLRGAIVVLAACSTFAPPTNVLVTRTPPGDRAVQEEGPTSHLGHWQVLLPREGLKRGFFVAKSDLEWRHLWPTTDPDKIPLLPFDVDFSKEMLFVSSPTDAEATASEIRAAVQTDRAIHVYVTQTVLGTDCPASADTASKNYDIVRTPRVDDREVDYHVDTVFGDPCGKPPEAVVACKPDRSDHPLVGNLSVEPGTKVACVASEMKASRPVFDLTWVWDALPIGSTAKIDVAHNSRAVTFTPDVIGTYRLALEVSDDLERKGRVTGQIEVPPPPGPLALQMAWTKVDAQDDPDTFPRIDLHVLGLSPEMIATAKARAAAAGKNSDLVEKPAINWTFMKSCSLKQALSWCTTKAAGPTTIVTLDPAWTREFAIAVHYTDERVPGQPILCVRAYRDGKLRAERCDNEKRAADAWWEVGVIDGTTGKTPEAIARELAVAKAAAAAAAAAGDAGPDGKAPDGSAPAAAAGPAVSNAIPQAAAPSAAVAPPAAPPAPAAPPGHK